MKTLTIRGLPEEVHARLKERAKRNRRSLNQEVIASLVDDGERMESDRIAVALRAAREVRKGIVKPLSPVEIREGISEGRK